MALNNETIGISAEVAIARAFGIYISPYYEVRANESIIRLLSENNTINKIFDAEHIPAPIKHTAERQNSIDFVLRGNKTLSVKTNKASLGKVAPQAIGQPTAESYFSYVELYFKGFSLKAELVKEGLADTYESRAYIFKKFSMRNIRAVIDMYWKNLFECDYYLHFFNLASYACPLENYVALGKEKSHVWEDKFSFTQSLESWNESNTVKYDGISIGEFQVHRNRNCFKFRFNMDGIMSLFNK